MRMDTLNLRVNRSPESETQKNISPNGIWSKNSPPNIENKKASKRWRVADLCKISFSVKKRISLLSFVIESLTVLFQGVRMAFATAQLS